MRIEMPFFIHAKSSLYKILIQAAEGLTEESLGQREPAHGGTFVLTVPSLMKQRLKITGWNS
jgi:hypothetical protein